MMEAFLAFLLSWTTETEHRKHFYEFEFFECLFNATLTAEVISWRGRPDNAVAVL